MKKETIHKKTSYDPAIIRSFSAFIGDPDHIVRQLPQVPISRFRF